MKKRKFDYDLVRFIAMVSVVLFHINLCFTSNDITYRGIFFFVGNQVTWGQFGVSVFFILSGAMLPLSFESLNKKYDSFARIVAEYYKKRWIALMPAFLVAYFLVHFTFQAEFWPAGGNFIWTLLGIDGYLAMGGFSTCYIVGEWFVGAILIIYLLAPFLYKVIRKYPKLVLLIFIVYYILLIRFYPFQFPKEANFLVKLFDFVIGIYIGIYLDRIHPLLAVGGLALFLINRFVTIPLEPMVLVPVVGTASLIVIRFVGHVIQSIPGSVSEGFQRLITAIAGLSFEIFLVHHVLIVKYFSLMTNVTIGHKRYLLCLLQVGIEILLVAGAVSTLTAGIKKGVRNIVLGVKKEKA